MSGSLATTILLEHSNGAVPGASYCGNWQACFSAGLNSFQILEMGFGAGKSLSGGRGSQAAGVAPHVALHWRKAWYGWCTLRSLGFAFKKKMPITDERDCPDETC